MIFVCEPQCEGMSHEKVNSGFLTLVGRAFPGEPICVHAAPSHRDGLRAILAHDGIAIDKLEFRDFPVRDGNSIRGMIGYFRDLERLLRAAVAAGAREVLFLSTSPVLLRLLKRLHRRPLFEHLRFVFVLHADFEDIANDTFQETPVSAVPEPSLVAKLRSIRPYELPGKVAGMVARRVGARYSALFKARFREHAELERDASDCFAYIALSPHVVENARQYVDVDALGITAIEMPINYAPLAPPPTNEHLVLATFGYGDPAALRTVVEALDRIAPTARYELRIIGMDDRGLEAHPRVMCPSPGKRLTRADMERHAGDVDAFLILYDRRRYRLSCSGSIFEALSYGKPVLHLGNPCVAQFDTPEHEIGFRHDDLESLARTIAEMANDYQRARVLLLARHHNIARLRVALLGREPRLRAVLRPDRSAPAEQKLNHER